MELFDYLKFIASKWLWLVVGTVIGALAAGSIAYTAVDEYRASVSMYVQRAPDASNDNYFTYEGYYAQQVAVSFTDTALELLTNDEIIKRAAENAGLTHDVNSINQIKGAIVTKKDAPQLIKVDVTMTNRDEASRLAEGLAQAVSSRTSEIHNAGGDAKLTVAQINERPFVVLERPLLWLYAIVGALLGLIGALLAATLWEYLRHQRRSNTK
jgi:capsular polysaccharide biosynthesis protein